MIPNGRGRRLGSLTTDLTGLITNAETSVENAAQGVIGNTVSNAVLGQYKPWIYLGVGLLAFIVIRDLASPRRR